MLQVISIFLNLSRLDLWPKMWSVLENVPCAWGTPGSSLLLESCRNLLQQACLFLSTPNLMSAGPTPVKWALKDREGPGRPRGPRLYKGPQRTEGPVRGLTRLLRAEWAGKHQVVPCPSNPKGVSLTGQDFVLPLPFTPTGPICTEGAMKSGGCPGGQRDQLGGWRGPQWAKGSPRVESQARAPGGSLGPRVRGTSGASPNGSSDPQGSLPLTTTKQMHLSWHPNSSPSPSSPSIIQSPSLHHPHSLLPGHPQGSSHQSCTEFLTSIVIFNKAMKLLLYFKNPTLHFRVRFRLSDLWLTWSFMPSIWQAGFHREASTQGYLSAVGIWASLSGAHLKKVVVKQEGGNQKTTFKRMA